MLKEEIINKIRTNIGKGPEKVSARISKNFLIVEVHGILTPLEKQLLKTADGEEQVETIRNKLFSVFRDEYFSIIERILGAKIIECVTKTSVKYNRNLNLVVFEENVEKKIEDAVSRNIC